jgi:hypothetical protein
VLFVTTCQADVVEGRSSDAGADPSDDRVLISANPEDAAEDIGFDLQPVTEA